MAETIGVLPEGSSSGLVAPPAPDEGLLGAVEPVESILSSSLAGLDVENSDVGPDYLSTDDDGLAGLGVLLDMTLLLMALAAGAILKRSGTCDEEECACLRLARDTRYPLL